MDISSMDEFHKTILHSSALFRAEKFPCLQLAVVYGSGEGDHVADIGHAGKVHNAALKAQPEAGVAAGTVFS